MSCHGHDLPRGGGPEHHCTALCTDTTCCTFHVLRGSKYGGGGWSITGPAVDGWFPITRDGASWFARDIDLYATEADARHEASQRRRERTVRAPRPLYGDFAQLAQLHGIATDGTGRPTR